MCFFWNEIAECGIVEIDMYFKYIYVSKKLLNKREKKRINGGVTPVRFSTAYRDEVVCEIEKYYPISRKIEAYRT